jgi:hypothetical protein
MMMMKMIRDIARPDQGREMKTIGISHIGAEK